MPRNTLGSLHTRPVSRTFVRAWRDYRKLSQEVLADRAGVTKATLSRIETGKQPYGQRILESLAEVLECSPIDLLTRDPGDADNPWHLWEALKPEQRRQAARLIRALVDDSGQAA